MSDIEKAMTSFKGYRAKTLLWPPNICKPPGDLPKPGYHAQKALKRCLDANSPAPVNVLVLRYLKVAA